MRDNSIQVDFWERGEDEDVIFGAVQIPLHQFYSFYKNPIIVKNIIHNKLPITISDWWEPICNTIDGDFCGQVKILVALGSETQLENLEIEKGIKELHHHVKYISTPTTSTTKPPALFRWPGYIKPTTNILKTKKPECKQKVDVGVQSQLIDMDPTSKANNSAVQNILETFLTRLQEQKNKNIHVENATNTETIIEQNHSNKSVTLLTESLYKLSECRNATNLHLQKTSDLLDCLNDALSGDVKPTNTTHTILQDMNTFRAHIVIESALHLPCKRNYKSHKTKKRYTELLPSTYVTFESCTADVIVTPVVSKSCSPNWNFQCDVLLSTELLYNNRKRLIFKVWSKYTNSLHPCPQTDIVLGFAVLDLTVLKSGLPSVQGWFNIIDFTNKCNGQLKIDVTPLENIHRFNTNPVPAVSCTNQGSPQNNQEIEPKESLNRALKRKFTQLDEITQRLKTRLADVTKEDSDLSNDAFADEFEHDINTSSIENEQDLIGLPSTSNSSASAVERTSKLFSNQFISSADKELIQGKQRIDMLLEKLSLLSNSEIENSFSNRYVSGCSLQQNNEELFIQQKGVAPATVNQLPWTEIDSIPSLTELSDISSKVTVKTNNSDTSKSSISARFPVPRHAPEGAGNSVDDESSNS